MCTQILHELQPLQNKKDAFSKAVDTEILKSRSEIRVKKRPNTNTLVQKTSQILYRYNTFFKKPTLHLGDADTYFKHSLRNYNDFDLLRFNKWDSKLLGLSVKQVSSK